VLYVTTRSKADSYTSYRALHETCAPDGGFYVPMQLPVYGAEQLCQLKAQSFFEIVATVLNQFFSVRLSAWDVKACLGRNPVRYVTVGHKITVAEVYHTMDSTFAQIASRLYGKLTDLEDVHSEISDWAMVAIRIAVLFGTFAQHSDFPTKQWDVVVNADDFTLPMAVWYARQMGLPIGTILLCCNESASFWEFLQRGSFAVSKHDPILQNGMERLIWCTLGLEEARRFSVICREGGTFLLDFPQLSRLNHGLKAIVTSSKRSGKLISSIISSHAIVLDPQTAMAYGCLQDYRAATGISRDTLLLAEISPSFCVSRISRETGISQEKLAAMMTRS